MITVTSLQVLIRRVRELLQEIYAVISSIRTNVKIAFVVAAGVFSGCLTWTIYLYLSGVGKNNPGLMNLGPTILGLIVSSLPTKYYLESRERLISFRDLIRRGEKCEELTVEELVELKGDMELVLRETRRR